MRFLVRHGVVEAGPEATVLPDDLADREPALAQLAAAAVSGLPPAGPELRRRSLRITLDAEPGSKIVRPLCVEDAGFSLHAATRAGAEDATGRANLFRYILRPPIAQEHVQTDPDGLVQIVLKKPFRDSTVAVDMDPLSLLSRLAAAVPPPRRHTIGYAGVLASASSWRPLAAPPRAPGILPGHPLFHLMDPPCPGGRPSIDNVRNSSLQKWSALGATRPSPARPSVRPPRARGLLAWRP